MSSPARLAVAACIASAVCGSASAQSLGTLLVGWTIPNAFPSGAGNVPTGTFYSVGAGDMGVLTAGTSLSSTHQLASSGTTPTSYTSPAGNGSAYSFSSNVWKAGDYYEASFSTTGHTGIYFQWDQTRSSTGPATSELVVSLDGGSSWTTLIASYAVLQNAAPPTGPGSWSSSTYNSAFTSVIQLDSIVAGAANAWSVIVRMRALVDGVNSTGVFAPGGTSRIDNVMVYGTAIPAPGAVALLGLAGLAARRRRR